MKKSLKAVLFAVLALLAVLVVGALALRTKPAGQAPEKNPAETASSEAASPETTSSVTEEPPEEPAPTPDERPAEPYIFNPHIHSSLISPAYPDEYWEGLYNLIDALRAGEDTFACADRDVYYWCVSPARMADFFPGGNFALEDSFRLPDDAYADGVGKIVYKMDKEEWLKKELAFEEDLMKVVNDNVKRDYTDFEKCLAFADYIASTCQYDWNNDLWAGSFCQPLYERSGVCNNFAHFYSYLLLQCGVEALVMENNTDSDYPGFHSWTYVVVDGVGYQVDPTWMLRSTSEDGNLWLSFFMMSDADRADYGFDSSTFHLSYYPEIDIDCTDDRFAPLHAGYYEGFDREKKILYYQAFGEKREFCYGG